METFVKQSTGLILNGDEREYARIKAARLESKKQKELSSRMDYIETELLNIKNMLTDLLKKSI